MAETSIQKTNPQTRDNSKPLVVAISSRALFDLDESHAVFESEGLEAYARYQIDRENEFLAPGEAFQLVKKLLALNTGAAGHQGVEVILVSRNSADSGLRIFNSIEHHDLDIERAVFTNGESPFRYMKAIGTDLFLSGHADDVREALKAGFASAIILPGAQHRPGGEQLRIAFENVVLQQRSYDIVEVLYRNGASSELDALQALTLLLSTEATIPSMFRIAPAYWAVTS